MYLGILEADAITQPEIKEKIRKEKLRWRRKLFKTKLCSRNLIQEINSWVVSLVKYWELFSKWTRKELRQIDQRTNMLMTIHKALHLREDIDSICQEKEEEEDLGKIEDCMDMSIQELKD